LTWPAPTDLIARASHEKRAQQYSEERQIIHERYPSQSPADLRIGARGLHGRRLFGARQSLAAAHHRVGTRRSTHDDHRRRQLARRCRAPPRSRADGSHAPPRGALQHRDGLRHHQPRGVGRAVGNTPATRSSSPRAPRQNISACPPRKRFAAKACRPAPPAMGSSIAARRWP
jgi:hypothetical protein